MENLGKQIKELEKRIIEVESANFKDKLTIVQLKKKLRSRTSENERISLELQKRIHANENLQQAIDIYESVIDKYIASLVNTQISVGEKPKNNEN